jgi:hypothetical protein
MIVEEFAHPWKHLIIDNLLDEDTFKYIENYIVTKFDLNNIKRSYLEAHSVNSNSDIYQKLSPIILELKEKYFDTLNYAGKKLPDKIYPYIEIAICAAGFKYPYIHPDDISKLMTNVLYVTPGEGDGTDLYSRNNENSLVKSIEWKKNRALTFIGQNDDNYQKTWHCYGNTRNYGRATINMILSDSPNGKYY